MQERSNKYFIYDNPRDINIRYYIRNLFLRMQAIIYKIFMNMVIPKKKEKKYYSAICTIFKDEAKYLKEWIEFHKIIGVNHIYMYNNFSSDDYQEVIAPYIESGYVDLIDWMVPQGQLSAYAHCISNYRDESQWIGFIDIDEFVVPVEDDTVNIFLKKFEKNRAAVKIYWKLFGSSGRLNRNKKNLVTDDFYMCWEKYDEIGKCFYNTNYDVDFEFKRNNLLHHMFWGQVKGKNIPPVNCFDKICLRNDMNIVKNVKFPIQINHYFTKSYEEYLDKKKRGDVYFKIDPKDDEYFYKHDELCQGTDYTIYKYMIKLKREINR